jgi:hypothetical protein
VTLTLGEIHDAIDVIGRISVRCAALVSAESWAMVEEDGELVLLAPAIQPTGRRCSPCRG